jgi:hypothetical protein
MDAMKQPRDENGHFISLKTLLDERAAAHELVHRIEKEQLIEARQVVNNRLAQMNEFRGALEDQASKMVTRELFDTLVEKYNGMEKKMAFYAGAAAVAGFVLSFVIRLLGVGP